MLILNFDHLISLFQTQRGRIPVVMLDDLETKRLKKQLNEASHSGSVIRIAFEYVDFDPQYTLRLQAIILSS